MYETMPVGERCASLVVEGRICQMWQLIVYQCIFSVLARNARVWVISVGERQEEVGKAKITKKLSETKRRRLKDEKAEGFPAQAPVVKALYGEGTGVCGQLRGTCAALVASSSHGWPEDREVQMLGDSGVHPSPSRVSDSRPLIPSLRPLTVWKKGGSLRKNVEEVGKKPAEDRCLQRTALKLQENGVEWLNLKDRGKPQFSVNTDFLRLSLAESCVRASGNLFHKNNTQFVNISDPTRMPPRKSLLPSPSTSPSASSYERCAADEAPAPGPAPGVGGSITRPVCVGVANTYFDRHLPTDSVCAPCSVSPAPAPAPPASNAAAPKRSLTRVHTWRKSTVLPRQGSTALPARTRARTRARRPMLELEEESLIDFDNATNHGPLPLESGWERAERAERPPQQSHLRPGRCTHHIPHPLDHKLDGISTSARSMPSPVYDGYVAVHSTNTISDLAPYLIPPRAPVTLGLPCDRALYMCLVSHPAARSVSA
ncbi:hypothetical protein C8R44DRAFT_860694 [Mycena epipterygia]|nr:hypothetical protein C8R44DRAFT_860694 [Mycena epipterygia]